MPNSSFYGMVAFVLQTQCCENDSWMFRQTTLKQEPCRDKEINAVLAKLVRTVHSKDKLRTIVLGCISLPTYGSNCFSHKEFRLLQFQLSSTMTADRFLHQCKYWWHNFIHVRRHRCCVCCECGIKDYRKTQMFVTKNAKIQRHPVSSSILEVIHPSSSYVLPFYFWWISSWLGVYSVDGYCFKLAHATLNGPRETAPGCLHFSLNLFKDLLCMDRTYCFLICCCYLIT